jgi:bidirectional [NiFe] hydrogenase diaphorase subunit
MGTACYIKGAPVLLAEAEKWVGLRPGETSPDGKVSFLTARCLGSCSLAPVVVFDGEVEGKVEAAELESRLQRWTSHAS